MGQRLTILNIEVDLKKNKRSSLVMTLDSAKSGQQCVSQGCIGGDQLGPELLFFMGSVQRGQVMEAAFSTLYFLF